MKKNFFLYLIASLMMTTAFAQSEKYVKAMEAKVPCLILHKTPDGLKDLANSFERIADAEKTQWCLFIMQHTAT